MKIKKIFIAFKSFFLNILSKIKFKNILNYIKSFFIFIYINIKKIIGDIGIVFILFFASITKLFVNIESFFALIFNKFKEIKLNKNFFTFFSLTCLVLGSIPFIYILSTNGFSVIKGDIGDKGNDGNDGKNGNDGINGNDGEDGKNGIDGVSYFSYYGISAPNNELGKDGDSYQNIKTDEYYIKEDGKFKKVASFKGDKGDKGNSGKDGDFFPISSLNTLENSLSSSSYGDIFLNRLYGEKNDRLVITFIPDEGFKLSSFIISGNTYFPISSYEKGTYTYETVMGDDLSISANFTSLGITYTFNTSSSELNKEYDGIDLEIVEVKIGKQVTTDYSLSWEKYDGSSYLTYSDPVKDVGTYKGIIKYLNNTKKEEFIYSITPCNVSISLNAENKVYDGTSSATINNVESYTSGLVDGEEISIKNISASFNDPNVGETKEVNLIDKTIESKNINTKLANYNFSFSSITANITSFDAENNKPEVITIDETNESNNDAITKTYDGRSIDLGTISFNDSNLGTLTKDRDYKVKITKNGINVDSSKDAGTYNITYSFINNYKGSLTKTYIINKKPVTIKNLTVNNKAYNGNTIASIDNVSTYPTGVEGESFSLSNISATFTENANVGNSKQVKINDTTLIEGNGDTLLTNYDISWGNTTGNIVANDLSTQVSFSIDETTGTSFTKTYNGESNTTPVIKWNDVTLTSGTDYDIVYKDSKNNQVTNGMKDADNYTIEVTYKGNYSGSNTFSYIINKKEITVKDLTVTSKTYDGNTNATIADVDYDHSKNNDIIDGDSLKICNINATYSDENVGSDKLVTINSSNVNGIGVTNKNNYIVKYGTTKGNITQLDISSSISLTIDSQSSSYNKNYDGNIMDTPVVKYNGSELIENQDYTISYYDNNDSEIDLEDIKNAGTYKGKITIANQNYKGSKEFTYLINKASLVIKDLTVTTKTYDGLTTASISGNSSYSTGIEGESFIVSSVSGTFNNSNAGENKVVTISSCEVTPNEGTLKSNYDISNGTTKGTITPLSVSSITFTIDSSTSLTKSYNGYYIGQNGAPIVSYNNKTLTSGTDYTITYQNSSKNNISQASVKDAETYYIVISLKGNYSGTFTKTYTINKRSITPSGLSVNSKRYDGNTNASISSQTYYTGVSGEYLTLSGISATYNNASVGTSKTVTINSISSFSAYNSNTNANNYSVYSGGTTTGNITHGPRLYMYKQGDAGNGTISVTSLYYELDVASNSGNGYYYFISGSQITVSAVYVSSRTFKGWYSEKDGEGTHYTSSYSYTFTIYSDINLYAYYKK